MKCYSCAAELIWGCDFDIDPEFEEDSHTIMTELSCSECNAFVIVYWGDKEDNEVL